MNSINITLITAPFLLAQAGWGYSLDTLKTGIGIAEAIIMSIGATYGMIISTAKQRAGGGGPKRENTKDVKKLKKQWATYP